MRQDEVNALQLWTQAQAQSATFSARTTILYNNTVATRPFNSPPASGGQYWTNQVNSGFNGSAVWSGSTGPGTFVTNGNPPSPYPPDKQ